MYIIGLHNGADAGVCLLKDGVILDAVSEERFSRKKLHEGVPELSLNYVLARHGLSVGAIDLFAYGWHGRQNDFSGYSQKLTERILAAVKADPSCDDTIRQRVASEWQRDGAVRLEYEAWMAALGIRSDKLMYLDHHASHAWSAFACSPFDEAHIFTFDGRGDLKSGTAGFGSIERGLAEHDYLLSFDSLGFLYGQITGYLGFVPHRHEGKVTGLAAYGNAERTLPLFRRLIRWEDNTIRSNLGFYRPFYTRLREDLVAELSRFSREDIAAGVQKHCEDVIAAYVQHWIGKSGRPDVRNVCLAGGLFANVKINQRIAEIAGVDNVFIFPHMGDGGLPAGAALLADHKINGRVKTDLSTLYLGPAYDDTAIRAALIGYEGRLRVETPNDKVGHTVEDLVNGKVIGWFDSRMEYGPRALGARSILYHTRDPSANAWLNKRMQRSEFMPFAPVTAAEHARECYVDWKEADICSHFMTRTYHCTPAFKERHQAVVHVDGTARPQIVHEALNGDYYRVVRDYCGRTGERALVNTSFNMHEEPIVCTPRDAVESLLRDIVDVLMIGSHRVVRVG